MSMSQMPTLSGAAAAASAGWGSNASAYRPLNVRDALSYLDQVKVSASLHLHEHPVLPILGGSNG